MVMLQVTLFLHLHADELCTKLSLPISNFVVPWLPIGQSHFLQFGGHCATPILAAAKDKHTVWAYCRPGLA